MSKESALIDDLMAKYMALPDEKRAELDKFVVDQSAGHLWFPTVGPQLDAVNCLADVMLYGGTGGSGKTDLILGCAFENHKRTLVIRKHYVDLTAIMDRAKEINGTEKGFRGSIPPRLKTVNGKIIDFGGLAQLGDEAHWQGQPHDLLAVDEVVQNREAQIRFLMGWVRTTNPEQRCRVIFASNPPTDPAGDWIIPMFAPWLDPRHPEPARPGELRYVVSDKDGRDMWVDGPEPIEVNGKVQRPMSRTFIPGTLTDNPFLAKTGYASQLDALPEPLRSAIRDGNFMAARQDEADQLIPTEWVRRAQNRWQLEPPYGVPQCAMGVDAARNKDKTVLARRHDGWYAPMIVTPGSETPHGTDVAALVMKHRRHDSVVIFDCGETNGAQAYAHCKENGVEVRKHIGMDKSTARTAERQLSFFNKRSEVLWKFREALDPGQDGGSPIALPDDPEIVSDLTAPRWSLTPQGIKATKKSDVIKMLGRSPDKGDAIVMAWAAGPKATTHLQEWRPDQRVGKIPGGKKHPTVNFGPHQRRRRT